jgi:hypothetical protein
MRKRISVLVCAVVLGSVMYASLAGVSTVHAEEPSGRKNTSTPAVIHSADGDEMRLQGEFRYRANCGRCHAAPRKFPPRMMATVLRHMRVRATITDEDMKLVLFYMSQ